MATSTPFPSRPTSVENTEDSVSDPYGATTLQPTHHTLSSGIGKYIVIDNTGMFWKRLTCMATSTPIPSRPISAVNTEDSVSDPYGASTQQPRHQTMSRVLVSISRVIDNVGVVWQGL